MSREPTPRLSVVIASKVGEPFIDDCLRSIEREALELGAETIVVSAGTEAYAQRIATAFPWVRVIHSPEINPVPALFQLFVTAALYPCLAWLLIRVHGAVLRQD